MTTSEHLKPPAACEDLASPKLFDVSVVIKSVTGNGGHSRPE